MDKYNQRWVRIFCLFRKVGWAITLNQTTYYSLPEEEVAEDPDWIRHENIHKRQWREEGVLKFAIKYFFYVVRYGYWNNPYEVEARNNKGRYEVYKSP